MGDTLIDCASVLGGGRMLQLLVEPLLELSKQVGGGWLSKRAQQQGLVNGQSSLVRQGGGICQSMRCRIPNLAMPLHLLNPPCSHTHPPTHPLLQVTSGGNFDWRTAEAALYCVRAVHRCAPLPGDALMMSLFSSLPMLPAVPQLQYTVALTVGAYSDWLADTAQRGEEGRTLLGQVGRQLLDVWASVME